MAHDFRFVALINSINFLRDNDLLSREARQNTGDYADKQSLPIHCA